MSRLGNLLNKIILLYKDVDSLEPAELTYNLPEYTESLNPSFIEAGTN